LLFDYRRARELCDGERAARTGSFDQGMMWQPVTMDAG
jgi:hypothetical protein